MSQSPQCVELSRIRAPTNEQCAARTHAHELAPELTAIGRVDALGMCGTQTKMHVSFSAQICFKMLSNL